MTRRSGWRAAAVLWCLLLQARWAAASPPPATMPVDDWPAELASTAPRPAVDDEVPAPVRRRARTKASGRYRVSLDLSPAFGSLPTHLELSLSLSVRLLRYLELQMISGAGFGAALRSFQQSLGAALVLPLPGRFDLAFGSRAGVADLRPGERGWVLAFAVSVFVEGRFAVSPAWELRFAPLAASGYWSQLWGFALTPSLGVAARF